MRRKHLLSRVWLVIGERRDGSRVVLCQSPSREGAERQLPRLQLCEDYCRLMVERARRV